MKAMEAPSALQDCLRAEHAAVYGYGVVGGIMATAAPASPDRANADASYLVHRDRRDRLAALIDGLDADPAAAEPAYQLPFEVGGRAGARRLARRIEDRAAAVYAQAVAATVGATRELVAEALTDCAVRGVAWGAAPEAFPGLAEL